jgi:hypothetical protein
MLIVGAVLTVAGTALFSWQVAVIVAGVLLMAGGADLSRTGS